jgi:pimeloyl-ACP methyl ester carboxylesterase
MTAENATDAAGPDTIVLIHGLWMTPRSWECSMAWQGPPEARKMTCCREPFSHQCLEVKFYELLRHYGVLQSPGVSNRAFESSFIKRSLSKCGFVVLTNGLL